MIALYIVVGLIGALAAIVMLWDYGALFMLVGTSFGASSLMLGVALLLWWLSDDRTLR
ncbi:hypothetical protein [Microvirga aerophila]|jgi:hypothetical protein|uniref:Uncharacterized protein n=1 Tax=Microvirga aerophila TaxID=670291 RepID=A0A512C0S2_9HYPH|nr:hypothetical protein [Microvirga aerophila]GEO17814.1 hypothetical protein MAE02_55100 [Microvirga aerophila]